MNGLVMKLKCPSDIEVVWRSKDRATIENSGGKISVSKPEVNNPTLYRIGLEQSGPRVTND